MPQPKDYLPSHYHRLPPFVEYFGEGIPMLMYHAVSKPPAGTKYRGLFYPPGDFKAQLSELIEGGFSSCNPAEVRDKTVTPNRRVSLTFDDGFASLHEAALTPLMESGLTATVYLVPDMLGRANEWDRTTGVAQCPLMDEVQIREWLAAGQRIGSHTCGHAHLPQLSEAAAREEISASRKKLEDIFGVRVEDFAYPYGEWTQREADLVAEAGYTTACTTRFGLNNGKTSAFALRRITARTPVISWKSLKKWVWRKCRGRG